MKFNLKFSQQILLFVTLPILIQLVCLSWLWVNVNNLSTNYEREVEASDYLSENVKFLAQLMTCAGSQAMYQATKDPKYLADFNQLIDSATKTSVYLRERGKHYLRNQKDAAALDALYASLKQLSDRGKSAVETQDQVELAVAFLQVKRVIGGVNKLSLKNLDAANEQRAIVARDHIEAKNQIFNIFIAALVLNVVLIAVYWINVYRKTSYRFKQLEDNIVALGSNQPLKHSLSGGDDLTSFDTVLHRVAQIQQESRLKEQAIVLNAVDVICAMDETFKFTQINPAAEWLWRFNSEELLGRNFISMVAPQQRDSVSSAFKNCMGSDEFASLEIGVVSGLKQTVEMQWNVIWSNEMKQFFCVAHDISERKQLERLRRELVAMVSHDLRSPMTSMQVTLNILSSGALGELPSEALKRVNRLELSLTQLVELVNDFLEVEKLESDDFQISTAPTQASRIVANGTALVEELANQQEIKIETRINDFELECDEARLTRVITNLVSNAIKFSPKQSKITVSAKKENGFGVFEVADQGRGIPAEQQELMFERFKQLELDDERVKKGSGLGLAVCKSIVAAHEGEILVESEVDKGSTFLVKIPMTRSART